VCLEARNHCVTAVGSARDAQAEAALRVFDLAFVDPVFKPARVNLERTASLHKSGKIELWGPR
jgi:hypothetical protein